MPMGLNCADLDQVRRPENACFLYLSVNYGSKEVRVYGRP